MTTPPISERLAFDPAGRSTCRELLRELNLEPNRLLGQNFLVNAGILDKVIRIAAVEDRDSVLEIGPGLGALTCRTVTRAGRVVAVEKDARLAEMLRTKLPGERLTIVTGDALTLSWDELRLPEQNVKVVANLPYSISKPMLRRILEEWHAFIQSATLMVQREVADRLLARPASAAYGPLAIMTQLYTTARREFDVSPGSFVPPPKVSSSVVHLQILAAPSISLTCEPYFWRVVRAAFSQRRKQLVNTLKGLAPDRGTIAAALDEAGIAGQRRGETLSLEEFSSLADALQSRSPSSGEAFRRRLA